MDIEKKVMIKNEIQQWLNEKDLTDDEQSVIIAYVYFYIRKRINEAKKKLILEKWLIDEPVVEEKKVEEPIDDKPKIEEPEFT